MSDSSKRGPYLVGMDHNSNFACNCPAFKYGTTRPCKHIIKLMDSLGITEVGGT